VNSLLYEQIRHLKKRKWAETNKKQVYI